MYAIDYNGNVLGTSVSDGIGVFRMESLPSGTYNLVISHPSYNVGRFSGVQITDDSVTGGLFSLSTFTAGSKVTEDTNPLGLKQ